MMNDWHELTDLTGDRRFLVTEVRMDTGISIQGEFELPPLARLRYEDQVFVSEFVRSHGSIKDMEKAFGISYPTVKNRLNRIVDAAAAGRGRGLARDRGRRSRPARARRDLGGRGGGEAAAMNVPPAILDLRIASPDRRPRPPVAAAVPAVAAGPGARRPRARAHDPRRRRAAACSGQRYHHYTILLARSFAALARDARDGHPRQRRQDDRRHDGPVRRGVNDE